MRTQTKWTGVVLAMAMVIAACAGPDTSDDATDDAPAETVDATDTATTDAADDSEIEDAEVVDVAAVEGSDCGADELCVTVMADEVTGTDLRLMLYEAVDDEWPERFRTLPTPSWVISEYPPIPESFPLEVRIPFTENLFAITSSPLEGSRLGLAIVTGVASIITVETTDARGFSTMTLTYEPGASMDFGTIELAVPAGDTCELNAFNPICLSGDIFWETRLLGEPDFVPGAIYLDVYDLDGDGVRDIITVGEPHFGDPDRPLSDLKLGVYYMNSDLTVRATGIIDEWSEDDQTFYSPWGVRVVEHSGEPVIVVGTNIPELAPLEDGSGAVLSYRQVDGEWVRTEIVSNPDPIATNYNAMIVVTCDIDADGDEDVALSSAFGSSSVGNWLENTGQADPRWILHSQPIDPSLDPEAVRGILGYKCTDLDGDGYPEVAYNAMFDIPGSEPPRYRGEIWLGLNPGPDGWDDPWEKVIIDDDNWASADMWFEDLDLDGDLDLIANQIFSQTVTFYEHPGDDLTAEWTPEVFVSDLTSPSDMWWTDVDGDGAVDLVSADHTAHNGVWHRNTGVGGGNQWVKSSIFRNINMPGDFAMADLDGDGDEDWVGVSVTSGQAFIVERVDPEESVVVTMSLPDQLDTPMTRVILTLAEKLPVTGIPKAILAVIDNVDADQDGELDVDQLFGDDGEVVLGFDDVGLSGEFYVVASIYVEGGGDFMPESGIDYMAASEALTFGEGTVATELTFSLAP